MSFQSGNRFGSSRPDPPKDYFNNQTSMPDITLTNNPQSPNSYESSSNISTNYSGQDSTQNALPFSSQLAPFANLTPQQQQQTEARDFLLAPYNSQERIKIKAENKTKYNLAYNSILYKFLGLHLENLMVRYPEEFPGQLTQEMRSRLAVYRRNFIFFHKLAFGGVFYWLLLRKRSWFRMTGNSISRWTYLFLTTSYMMDMNHAENIYLSHQIFENNKVFEGLVWKYNINPDLKGPFKIAD